MSALIFTQIKENEMPTPSPDISVIQTIVNNYGTTINFVNTEKNVDNRIVPPGQQVGDGAWVPWCDLPAQFAAHHIQITSEDGQAYYVWQSGPSVWGNQNGFTLNGTNLGPEGKMYTLTVSANFQISLS
jgi:hypothetical protein